MNHARCLIALLGVVWIISVAGCGTGSTPPAPDTILTTAPGMNITFLRWKEGLSVLYVDDVKGGHRSGGSGSTRNPVHTATIVAGSPKSGGYECKLESKDGKSAICRINGKDYDLTKGTLFVIKSNEEKAEVHQLKRDLTIIPFDEKTCRKPIQEDEEIRKLLGLDDGGE